MTPAPHLRATGATVSGALATAVVVHHRERLPVDCARPRKPTTCRASGSVVPGVVGVAEAEHHDVLLVARRASHEDPERACIAGLVGCDQCCIVHC